MFLPSSFEVVSYFGSILSSDVFLQSFVSLLPDEVLPGSVPSTRIWGLTCDVGVCPWCVVSTRRRTFGSERECWILTVFQHEKSLLNPMCYLLWNLFPFLPTPFYNTPIMSLSLLTTVIEFTSNIGTSTTTTGQECSGYKRTSSYTKSNSSK